MTDRARVKTYSYRHDAELAMSLLEAAGIQAYITADDAGGQAVGIQFSGGVKLWVPAPELERARSLLSDVDKPATEPPEIDLEDLAIRALDPLDAEDCFRIRTEAMIRVLADELERDAVAAAVNAHLPSDYATMAETRPSFAAVVGDRLIGFYILLPLDPKTVEIYLVYVHLSYLGRGIGTQLLLHAEAWVRENRPDTTWLMVDTVSPNYNRGFYESLGYKPIGDHIYPYGDLSVPALRLRKALSPPKT